MTLGAPDDGATRGEALPVDDRIVPAELDEGSPVRVDPLRLTPQWLTLAFRVLTAAMLTFYFFVVYCNMRTLAGAFGPSATTIAMSLAATLTMSVMVVFLVGLPELPEAIVGHVRPRLRAGRGRCPRCGYDRHGLVGACPECGGSTETPPAYRLGWHAIRRFGMLLLVAWLLGSVAGEWWMVRDERAFVRQVEAMVEQSAQVAAANGASPGDWRTGFFGVTVNRLARDRAWPCAHAQLEWTPEHGYSAAGPFGAPRIPGWRPAPSSGANPGGARTNGARDAEDRSE